MELLFLSIVVFNFPIVSATLQFNAIDFGNSLQTFKDCAVHIDAPIIEGNKNLFIVEPLMFPVVLSRHLHELHPFSPLDASCQNRRYREKKGSGFLFPSVPPQKLNCFVQVVLNEPCFEKDLTNNISPIIVFFPPGFFNVIFDRRVRYTREIVKCCTFLIHVVTKELGLNNLNAQKQKKIHYIDTGYHFIHALQHVTKLFFTLELSKESNRYQIGARVVKTCPDVDSWLQIVLQHCSQFLEKHTLLQECKLSIPGLPSIHDNLVPYDDFGIGNWKSVETLYSCSSMIIGYMGKYEYENHISARSAYIRDWNQMTVNDVEPLFLGMIFPNCSVMDILVATRLLSTPQEFGYKTSINPTLVSTQFDKIEFITCVPISKPAYLSLAGYASAFDLTTWLVIALSLCFSINLWHYAVSKFRSVSLSTTLLSYNILVGQGTSEIKWARLITGSWVIAGVFLTNNYQGNNIDMLTSPLIPETIETFEEVFESNLSVFSLPVNRQSIHFSLNGGVKGEVALRLVWSAASITMSDMYFRRQISQNVSELKLELERFVKIPGNWSEAKIMIEDDYYISKIAECGLDVFVDTLDNVNKIRFGLTKRQINKATIATSKESYGNLYQQWRFDNFKVTVVTLEKRFGSLIQSGIFHLWKEWKYRIDTWNDTLQAAKFEQPPSASAKALSTDGNIVVVLYLHLTLLSVSILLFLYECGKWLVGKIAALLLVSFKLFKECFGSCFSFKLRSSNQLAGCNELVLDSKVILVRTRMQTTAEH